MTTTDKLIGTISTTRFPAVRYRIGHDCGDTFGAGSDYDGLALTLEAADEADARAMLDAISRRRASQAAPAPSDGLRDLRGMAWDLAMAALTEGEA